MRVGDSAIALYIQNHFKNLLTSLLLFAIGVFGGSLYCVTMPASETESLRTVFTGAQGLFSVSESLRVFTATFLNYLQLWILLSLCGTCFLGTLLAPVLIGLRGFVCGFCISLFILLFSNRAVAAVALGILPQMLLVLPAMQMLCAGAATHVQTLNGITDRARRRTQFLSYCAYCLLFLIVFAAAALYEGYIGWGWVRRLLS